MFNSNKTTHQLETQTIVSATMREPQQASHPFPSTGAKAEFEAAVKDFFVAASKTTRSLATMAFNASEFDNFIPRTLENLIALTNLTWALHKLDAESQHNTKRGLLAVLCTALTLSDNKKLLKAKEEALALVKNLLFVLRAQMEGKGDGYVVYKYPGDGERGWVVRSQGDFAVLASEIMGNKELRKEFKELIEMMDPFLLHKHTGGI